MQSLISEDPTESNEIDFVTGLYPARFYMCFGRKIHHFTTDGALAILNHKVVDAESNIKK